MESHIINRAERRQIGMIAKKIFKVADSKPLDLTAQAMIFAAAGIAVQLASCYNKAAAEVYLNEIRRMYENNLQSKEA